MKDTKKHLALKSRILSTSLSRRQAIRLVETSYLAATSALIWIALYYFPIGGAFFRLALPLPLSLLQVRRGPGSGVEGVTLLTLILVALMGPIRGPLVLFPYGFLALWLGWSWHKRCSWWLSWGVGTLLGTFGFIARVALLSVLVGENLWIVVTRAGTMLLERLIELLNLSLTPDFVSVQLIALLLVVFQEVVFVLTVHAVAYWIFPRLKASIPEPPPLLHSLVVLEKA